MDEDDEEEVDGDIDVVVMEVDEEEDDEEEVDEEEVDEDIDVVVIAVMFTSPEVRNPSRPNHALSPDVNAGLKLAEPLFESAPETSVTLFDS